MIAMIAVAAMGAGISIMQTLRANTLGQDVMSDLRRSLFGDLQTLSLRFFAGTRTGEIQSRLTSDVAGVQTVVASTVAGLLGIVVSSISALIAMLILSWQLTVVVLVLVPRFFWLMRRVGDKRRAVAKQTQEAVADITVLTEESLSGSGVLLAKVFYRQCAHLAAFDRDNQTMAALMVRQNMIGYSLFTTMQVFLGITPVFVYLVAGYLTNGPSVITAGTVVAFTILATRLYFPIGQLLQTLVEIRTSLAYFERIFKYLDLEP